MSMVSVSCARTEAVAVGWVRWFIGVDCAVDSDADDRMGLEGSDGSAAVSGEVLGEMVSSSRTEVYEG